MEEILSYNYRQLKELCELSFENMVSFNWIYFNNKVDLKLDLSKDVDLVMKIGSDEIGRFRMCKSEVLQIDVCSGEVNTYEVED